MKNIIKATRSDKPKVLEILTEAFWDDPHINWFTGSGKNKRKRLETMMSHAFESALARGDVYLTEDKQAVAIWRNSSQKVKNLYTFMENIKFLYHYGLKKVQAISKLERIIQEGYPKDKPFYYLFIIGTSKKGRGKGLSSILMNNILEQADQNNIPVYLETANVNNVPIYNKKGFKTYREIPVAGEKPITLNLMSRYPVQLN
jgi:ribosomal protein S18 acetylase RimI-like enzyme